MSVSVIAILYCKTDTQLTLDFELKKLVEASASEEGCTSYELYQCSDDPEKYIIIERWINDEVLAHHKNMPHYKHFVHISPALLAKPVEIKRLNRLV